MTCKVTSQSQTSAALHGTKIKFLTSYSSLITLHCVGLLVFPSVYPVLHATSERRLDVLFFIPVCSFPGCLEVSFSWTDCVFPALLGTEDDYSPPSGRHLTTSPLVLPKLLSPHGKPACCLFLTLVFSTLLTAMHRSSPQYLLDEDVQVEVQAPVLCQLWSSMGTMQTFWTQHTWGMESSQEIVSECICA